MNKNITKNRDATKQLLIHAVGELVEEYGFEKLGVNAIAAKAGVSKMLIYRYFESLDGLIAAYIRENDFWINFDIELPDTSNLSEFIKKMFREQISTLRNNYTLRRLYRWELLSNNVLVEELRKSRESKGVWIVEAVSRLSKSPEKEVAVMATLITASINYLVLLEEVCPVFNGIQIQQNEGWKQIEDGIEQLIDIWIKQNKE